jgi:FtsP/CotA-like multicopper oxidase with cupredoxin domain
LVATPDLRGVHGMLELHRVPSPFGVSVTADGQLRHQLVARLRGLPRPDSLDASVFVAWGYDVTMGREIRLGLVTNGTTVLGELPYEHFRVLVSAESSRRSPTRRGRLVARATSPMALMLAHRDAVAPLMTNPGSEMGGGEHAGHVRWPMPPADPRLAAAPMAHSVPTAGAWLPEDAPTLPLARPREVLAPRDGDTLRLTASRVRRTIGGKTFVMYGYNGQYPGPLIQVRQASEVVVRFHNAIDLPTTVHWHGVRLENASDGVPHVTQEPVAPGDSFTYRLRFPDAGLYWYHPHVREDIQQELGLYGNILVAARRARARAPVHREEVLALDDLLLLEGEGPMPFGADTATHALMGRFGNTLLVNGEPNYRLDVRNGEVVRFYLTNVANARVMNVRIPGARLKLVGSDLGDFEREEWVESVVLAPAERYVVEARFPRAGVYAIVNAVRWLDHMRGTTALVQDTLGVVRAAVSRATPDYAAAFARLAESRPVGEEFAAVRRRAARPVDHALTLSLRLSGVTPNVVAMLTGIAMPVDWNDGMPMMNWPLSAREVAWTLRDEAGRENMDIRWQFRVGDVARIRLVNEPSATHAMAHPFHIHGQRFAVISRNGVPNDNMVWKDTALVPAGETIDILLELSNPGLWMMHCHVAEHLGTGMMGMFEVR